MFMIVADYGWLVYFVNQQPRLALKNDRKRHKIFFQQINLQQRLTYGLKVLKQQ